MTWWQITIISIVVITIITKLYLAFKGPIFRYIKIYHKTIEVIQSVFPETTVIKYDYRETYQLEFTNQKKYLIKVIPMNPKHELIITNADKVVINEDIKGWKRSTKPQFVPGIKSFMSLKKEQTIKIVLIDPTCHNITKYINESDAYQVKKYELVDGLYFVRFDQLKDFLEKTSF